MNGSRVLVLGLAYKPNVDDDRESPSYVLMDLLKERGRGRGLLRSLRAGHPAHARTSALGGHALGGVEPARPWTSFDAVIIATNHQAVNYQELADWAQCIVDTRNAMAGITNASPARSGRPEHLAASAISHDILLQLTMNEADPLS